MSVAISNTCRRNARGIHELEKLERFAPEIGCSLRHSMSFFPLVDQLHTVVKSAFAGAAVSGAPEVGDHRLPGRQPLRPCTGTGKCVGVPTFSPNVNRARVLRPR
jgi:hypothetical protein